MDPGFERMRVVELRQILRSKRMSASGNKAELVSRLLSLAAAKRSPGAAGKRKKKEEVVGKSAKRLKRDDDEGGSESRDAKEAWMQPLESHPALPVISGYLPDDNVAKIVAEYAPSSLMILHRALKRGPKSGRLRPVIPEALLFLFMVKEAQHFYTPRRRKKKGRKKQKGNKPVIPKAPKPRGWGFGTLYSALRGSRAEKVRKTGITNTLGWGRHLDEEFWRRLCKVLQHKKFLNARYMTMSYGGGDVYTLAELGESAVEEVGDVGKVLRVIEKDISEADA